MFCESCGSPVEQNQKFCAGCGAPNPGYKDLVADKNPICMEQQFKKKGGKKVFIIAGVCVFAVILICIALSKSLGKPYLKPVDTLVKWMNYGNTEDLMGAFPDEFYEYLEDEEYMDKAELEYNFDNIFSDFQKENPYDGITYEIRSVETMDKDDFKDLKNIYQRNYTSVTDARVIGVKFIAMEDKKEVEKKKMNIIVIKVRGKWYLDWLINKEII